MCARVFGNEIWHGLRVNGQYLIHIADTGRRFKETARLVRKRAIDQFRGDVCAVGIN